VLTARFRTALPNNVPAALHRSPADAIRGLGLGPATAAVRHAVLAALGSGVGAPRGFTPMTRSAFPIAIRANLWP